MSGEPSKSESGGAYCIQCGEQISAGTNYCPHCGADQTLDSADGKSEPEAPANSEQGLRHSFPGVSRQNSTRRNVLVGTGYAVLGLGIVGALSGSGGDTGNDGASSGGGESDPSTPTPEQYPDAWYFDPSTEIVLRDVEGFVGEFSTEITGEATNTSDRDYEYVQLGFALFDSTDAKVGDALANTSGLSAGQRWRFEAIGTQTENVDTFDIEDVTAY